MFQTWRKRNGLVLALITTLLVCSSCISTWLRSIDDAAEQLARASVEPIPIVILLGIYQRALETKDIYELACCFTSDFHSPLHDNLDSLKEEMVQFFANYEIIEVDLEDVEIEINIPADDPRLTATEGVVKIEAIAHIEAIDYSGPPAKYKFEPMQYKFVVNELDNIEKPEAILTFVCKIRALSVESEHPSKNIYFKKERKSFYLRKQNDEWKIESEKLSGLE